jgi:hypothetical protein
VLRRHRSDDLLRKGPDHRLQLAVFGGEIDTRIAIQVDSPPILG